MTDSTELDLTTATPAEKMAYKASMQEYVDRSEGLKRLQLNPDFTALINFLTKDEAVRLVGLLQDENMKKQPEKLVAVQLEMQATSLLVNKLLTIHQLGNMYRDSLVEFDDMISEMEAEYRELGQEV